MSALDTFGQRLSELISDRGMKQGDFAKQINASPAFLSNIIKGVKKPGLDFLFRLVNHYGVSLDWLVLNKGRMNGGAEINSSLLSAIAIRIELAKLASQNDLEAKKLINQLSGEIDTEQTVSIEKKYLLEYIHQVDDHSKLLASLYNEQIEEQVQNTRLNDILESAINYFQKENKDTLPNPAEIAPPPKKEKNLQNDSEIMHVLYMIEVADASCGSKEQSLSVKLLHSLQVRKKLNDEQLAHLIEIDTNELIRVKNGSSSLSSRSKFKLFDGFGYILVRDMVLSFLPNNMATRLKELDLEHGKKLNTPE